MEIAKQMTLDIFSAPFLENLSECSQLSGFSSLIKLGNQQNEVGKEFLRIDNFIGMNIVYDKMEWKNNLIDCHLLKRVAFFCLRNNFRSKVQLQIISMPVRRRDRNGFFVDN